MKRRKLPRTKAEQKDFDVVCAELGEDVVRQLYEAYTLTAGALYRRAAEQAKARLQEAEK
jgi:hypothetical protein